MKWVLVVMSLAASGWASSRKEEYPMPDKETCYEAIKASKVDNDPKAERTVIIFCAEAK